MAWDQSITSLMWALIQLTAGTSLLATSEAELAFSLINARSTQFKPNFWTWPIRPNRLDLPSLLLLTKTATGLTTPTSPSICGLFQTLILQADGLMTANKTAKDKIDLGTISWQRISSFLKILCFSKFGHAMSLKIDEFSLKAAQCSILLTFAWTLTSSPATSVTTVYSSNMSVWTMTSILDATGATSCPDEIEMIVGVTDLQTAGLKMTTQLKHGSVVALLSLTAPSHGS